MTATLPFGTLVLTAFFFNQSSRFLNTYKHVRTCKIIKCHLRGIKEIFIPTVEACMSSSVIQTFHNGQPICDGVYLYFERMTALSPIGTRFRPSKNIKSYFHLH